MSRPAALPIEKWNRHTVSGELTCAYSHKGRARDAMRGCTLSANMSDSKPARRRWPLMARASLPMASP
jgi:hypothetical protein